MRDKNGWSSGKIAPMIGILNGAGTGLNDSGMFSDKHNWLSYLYARLIHGDFIKIYPDETVRVPSDELKKNVEQKIIGDSTYNKVKVAEKIVIENYAEGGASTAKGGGVLSDYVLKVLGTQRTEFLHHENLIPKTEKTQLIKETLLFQMLGANDYVTANEKPTKEAANLAMRQAIIHYKRMKELGYKNFTYAVIPDVSLSPGLQYKTSAEQISAHNLVHYLNKAYYDFVKIIKEEGNNDHLTIKIFDFNDTFLEELSSVKDFGGRMTCLGIKENNLKTGLKGKCPDFDDNTFTELKNKKAIKFYDASHPTSDVYIKIAQSLVKFLSEQYQGAKTN